MLARHLRQFGTNLQSWQQQTDHFHGKKWNCHDLQIFNARRRLHRIWSILPINCHVLHQWNKAPHLTQCWGHILLFLACFCICCSPFLSWWQSHSASSVTIFHSFLGALQWIFLQLIWVVTVCLFVLQQKQSHVDMIWNERLSLKSLSWLCKCTLVDLLSFNFFATICTLLVDCPSFDFLLTQLVSLCVTNQSHVDMFLKPKLVPKNGVFWALKFWSHQWCWNRFWAQSLLWFLETKTNDCSHRKFCNAHFFQQRKPKNVSQIHCCFCSCVLAGHLNTQKAFEFEHLSHTVSSLNDSLFLHFQFVCLAWFWVTFWFYPQTGFFVNLSPFIVHCLKNSQNFHIIGIGQKWGDVFRKLQLAGRFGWCHHDRLWGTKHC